MKKQPKSTRSHAKQESLTLYWRLLQYIRRYWVVFTIAMLGNVAYSGVDTSFTYLLKPILNKGFIAHDLAFIQFLPFIVVAAFIVRGMANFASNYFMARVARGVIMDFRQNIFAQLMRLPATYYDNTSSGKILSALLYNVDQISSAGSDAITTSVQSLCYIVGLLSVMFAISWRLSLIYFATVPVIAITVHFCSIRLRRISLFLQQLMGEVTNIAEEAVEGYKVVRAFGGQEYEIKKFNKATDRNRQHQLKIIITKSLSISGVQLIAAVVLAITIYLATLQHSTTLLSAGSFVSLIAAMLAILKPLKNFTNVNTKIQRGLAGAQSVFALLDEEPEQDTGTISVERVKGEVVYEHVDFTYPGTQAPVLHDLNFSIRAGQTVALVGHSGGGKSTLVNVLQRLYDGIRGHILIDGVEIRDYRLAALRKQFALVSQHVTLFNDTLRHNIAYGTFANATEGQIIEAAKAANAWEFIEQMPEKLDTLVGENGVLLSGGQRQRIAIARALLKDAPILILDEATSSLDTQSERQIQNALEKLMRNRTTFVIAHRLSTIENADMILVIDEGRIAEQGDHSALIARKEGLYATLYKMQFRDD